MIERARRLARQYRYATGYANTIATAATRTPWQVSAPSEPGSRNRRRNARTGRRERVRPIGGRASNETLDRHDRQRSRERAARSRRAPAARSSVGRRDVQRSRSRHPHHVGGSDVHRHPIAGIRTAFVDGSRLRLPRFDPLAPDDHRVAVSGPKVGHRHQFGVSGRPLIDRRTPARARA